MEIDHSDNGSFTTERPLEVENFSPPSSPEVEGGHEEPIRAELYQPKLPRQVLSEVVKTHYLTPERRGRTHRILAEYFQGRWSGRLKPAALPGLKLLLSDRKVPPQPLWFAAGLANVRKLQELPYHLLHAGLWEELRQEVIGSAEWLYCKSRVCGVASVISDLDQCFKYMNCSETGLVRDALILMKPSLDVLSGHMDQSLFYSELLARLSSLSSTFCAVIGQLCRQCEDWLQMCQVPVLIPKSSFLQQPGGALQHTLTAPYGGVLCLDIDVAVQLLVTGSAGGVVAVWSLEDKQLVHALQGPPGAILSVKIIESSTNCLSLAADGSLRRWSLKSGQQLLCIQEAGPVGPTPSSVHLEVSDELLFVYSWTQVKVWRPDGTEIHLGSSEDASLVMGVLGDSVVSLHGSDQVRISDPVTGTQIGVKLTRSLTPVNAVTSPNHGKMFVVSEDGFLHQISRTGKQTITQFPLQPSLFSVSEDEKILLAGCEETLSLFNISSNSVDRFLDLQHDDKVLSACVSSHCRHIISGAADQLIRIWSVTTGLLLDALCGCNSPVTSLLFYDGFVVSASMAAASVQLWSLTYDARHKPPAHIPLGSAHAAVAKDGDQVFYVHHQSQREVMSWNNRTGSLSERLAVSAEVSCLELAQHKRLLLCGLKSGTVLIYPLTFPQETLCIPPPESRSLVLCLAVSSQEKHLAIAYEDSVCLFEITTRDNFPTVEGPLGKATLSLLHAPLSCMALLPDRRLLYGTSCGEVKLHDYSSSESSNLQSHCSSVTCVTASNWGMHALVGSQDGMQRLWALNPVALDHTMEYKGLFSEGVLCAAFSDSDQFVFTGSQDRTIKVWDVASGERVYNLTGNLQDFISEKQQKLKSHTGPECQRLPLGSTDETTSALFPTVHPVPRSLFMFGIKILRDSVHQLHLQVQFCLYSSAPPSSSSGKLLYVQYVYSPVVRMVTFRNGFVALSLQGSVIQEAFRCPDHINPDHNPLRTIKAQYRVTSSERDRDSQQTCVCDLQDFNPARINLNFVSMLRTKPSSACILL
ncbi:hypothetical protein CRENBAI_011653 [Crenichthys baileyi]|uniref:NACHT and WD repeat domain containing 1 n=1 Tax=Crenichthys baileyi TaxID=28760 RepID=A0AAV9S742_9TELE